MRLPDEVRRLFAAYGRRGGETTARRLTKAQRIASASKAARARWKDHTAARKRKKRPRG